MNAEKNVEKNVEKNAETSAKAEDAFMVMAKIIRFRSGDFPEADRKRYILVDFEYTDPETLQAFAKTAIFDQASADSKLLLERLVEAATRVKGLASYIRANTIYIMYDNLVGAQVKVMARRLFPEQDVKNGINNAAKTTPSLGTNLGFVDFYPVNGYVLTLVPVLEVR